MEGRVLTRVVDGLERHLLMLMMMMMILMIFTDAGAADADNMVVLVVLIADWETDRLPA